MRAKRSLCVVGLLGVGLMASLWAVPQGRAPLTEDQKILQTMHTISSHTLFAYVRELASEKYGGRLTGTEDYDAAAEWVASHFQEWGIAPAADNGTYFQKFPIPYTLVFKGCEVSLHIPVG
ncbi:MAG: hypothetical protein ACE5LV_10185, partial [Candidatus Aminicenantales bacterium]